MYIKKYQSLSEKETLEITKEIFKAFPDKKILFLIGDLGSGKTVFAKGIAQVLGIKDKISSPTFAYKNIYPNFIHYDLYQASPDKIEELKFNILEESDNNYVLIEWADLLLKRSYLKRLDNYLKINIDMLNNDTRIITVNFMGE